MSGDNSSGEDKTKVDSATTSRILDPAVTDPPVSRREKVENVNTPKYTVRSIFSSLENRADIIGDGQLEPDKLKDIVVSATRGDCLNEEELKLFEEGMKKFCTLVVGAEPNEAQFAAFTLSLVQACLNQSTSNKNEKLNHLINTFTVAGNSYSWKTKSFISFCRGSFPLVSNPIRRYLRTIEDQIQVMKSTGKIESDGHLAAKHGTVSQYWNSTSDFMNGCKSNISDDDLAANYLQKQAALKGKKRERQIFNVSQLTGSAD
nr:coat protein [Crinivirus sp.]